MKDSLANPFNITKADDFSDKEINDLWVDITSGDGFSRLVKPTSPMPMFILGGKGSGKTHLMKYFSYSVQKIRHAKDVMAGIGADGYIGIYVRCGGLNASRFKGKQQTDEAWENIFAYYMDLRFSQLVLSTVQDVLQGKYDTTAERNVCVDIGELFHSPSRQMPDTFLALHSLLRDLQREVDSAVNNCALTGRLDVSIQAPRGDLVFGVPLALSQRIRGLSSLRFLYLIDEFENLSESQQKYVNTLIREKKEPVSFKIGARLYGVRTQSTYCADEDNKEGSEYEKLRLDNRLRGNMRRYAHFARQLIGRRLHDYGHIALDNPKGRQASDALGDQPSDALDNMFETPPHTRFGAKETVFVVRKYRDRERPYFESLRRAIRKGVTIGASPGVSGENEIETIIDLLRVDSYPLLEKVNLLRLYQEWYYGRSLADAAQKTSEECQQFIKAPRSDNKYGRVVHHFRADLMAQLCRECGGGRTARQAYTGLKRLIDVSWGIPRHLLILLKEAYAWAIFNGEEPFRDAPLSVRSQDSGVSEAAKWFFVDATMAGGDGKRIQDSIGRLATLFREIRFSNKPSECSVSAFSYDRAKASVEAKRIIDNATNWSLLIEVRDQRDRNSLRVDQKLQLNRMLAPRWDVPIYRRGVLALSTKEVNAIFDEDHVKGFDALLQKRVDRMTAPGFGRKPRKPEAKKDHKQDKLLPGFGDE